MHWYSLVLAVLAVWRVTHLLHAEDGPWSVFLRVRRAAGTGFAGQAINCFYCLSLWVAVPCAIAVGAAAVERVLLCFALSAGAILIERLTAETVSAAAPPFVEHRETT